ncbi:hypothetical protein F7734_59875 [Scytonema sp. UIC 10036]|uniref:hypothetical protein n=1 Tax=Scytonema sp. UIC 10036 TaxID=2304196 RepID=UPI0012DA2770|nr:hypothetical protein [Scytonema sp. UIC 10036]MUH01787.1 hypothetical protein [Scytonema sp. UIC 10036]
MAFATRIIFFQDTLLKQEPVQSSQLPSFKLVNIPAFTVLVLQSYTFLITQDHHRITLKNLQFKGFTSWYVFAPHVDIFSDEFFPIQTVGDIAAEQQSNNEVKIFVDRDSVGNQRNFLKIVANTQTVFKREPVDSSILRDELKQTIPAGTELVLATGRPDGSGAVRFPLVKNHVRFSLQNPDIKGFSSNWYAYEEHVGIDRLG